MGSTGSGNLHGAEWEPAKVEAARRGETLTDAIRRFLRKYGKGEVE